MNLIHRYEQMFLLCLLVVAVTIGPVLAQYARPQILPIPSQSQIMRDQQNVQQLAAFADHYNAQVYEYTIEITNGIEAIDAQNREYLIQIQSAENEIKKSGATRAKKKELSTLHAKIQNNNLLKEQGIKNINTARAWQNYVRAQVNNARYSITQDQRQVSSDMQLAQTRTDQHVWDEDLRRIEANRSNGYYPIAPEYDYDNYGDGPSYGNRYPRGRYNNRAYGHGGGGARGGGGVRSGGGGGARAGGGAGSPGGKH